MLVLKQKPAGGAYGVCLVCGEMFERFAFASLEKNPRGRSALAELRCATSGLEAVLAYSLAPVFLDFMGFLASALKCCPSI